MALAGEEADSVGVVAVEAEGAAAAAEEVGAEGGMKAVTLEVVAEVEEEAVVEAVEEVVEAAEEVAEAVEEVALKAEVKEALVASQAAGINHSEPKLKRSNPSASCSSMRKKSVAQS